jgi:hypothetical protein
VSGSSSSEYIDMAILRRMCLQVAHVSLGGGPSFQVTTLLSAAPESCALTVPTASARVYINEEGVQLYTESESLHAADPDEQF